MTQTEIFVEKVEEKLKEKVQLLLSVSKINYATNFKDSFRSIPLKNHAKKKKVECQRGRIETIKSQQVRVETKMCEIFKKIPVDMRSIELRFMSQMRYNVDSKQKQQSCNTMMKHWVLANLVEFKLIEFKEINAQIKTTEINNSPS